MKKLTFLVTILAITVNSFAQSTVFPQATNTAWKTSVNTVVSKPDTVQVFSVTTVDSVIYQYLTSGEVKAGRMSVVTNLLKLTDTLQGSLTLEGCNDNTGLSWAPINSIGVTNDTLAFTTGVNVLIKKSWNVDANWLKYRVVIRIKNDCKFVARTNSAWKRYYFNANLNN